MNLFPPSFMYFVISASELISGSDVGIGTMQPLIVVEGDIRAHLLTVGETALIKGEVIADDIVVNGRIVGRIRGLKVRLTASARVEGDIIHKTIAIESGAHFEGSVQRQEDPLNPNADDNKSTSSIENLKGTKP